MYAATAKSPETKGATPTLRVEQLGVCYGALVALEDVSWAVHPGELLGIIGPNGAGKSSCYEAVTAMVPRTGRVHFQSRDVTAMAPYRLAELGLKRAFQHNAFFDDLSVIENMIAALGKDAHSGLSAAVFRPIRAAGIHAKAVERAAHQLERFGIPALYYGMSPAEIPYGVQRMLSIAIAYGDGAKALLLDEPAAGLGGEDMERLKQLLASLKQEGIALVVIEHHMDLIMSVADQIYVLDLGRQLAYGAPPDIQKDPRVLDAYLGRSQ